MENNLKLLSKKEERRKKDIQISDADELINDIGNLALVIKHISVDDTNISDTNSCIFSLSNCIHKMVEIYKQDPLT